MQAHAVPFSKQVSSALNLSGQALACSMTFYLWKSFAPKFTDGAFLELKAIVASISFLNIAAGIPGCQNSKMIVYALPV